jgi:hypothetical protein
MKAINALARGKNSTLVYSMRDSHGHAKVMRKCDMPDRILDIEGDKQKTERRIQMQEYRGELILLRGSRKELLEDLEAVGQFLDERRAMQRRTPADAIQQAEKILREAA